MTSSSNCSNLWACSDSERYYNKWIEWMQFKDDRTWMKLYYGSCFLRHHMYKAWWGEFIQPGASAGYLGGNALRYWIGDDTELVSTECSDNVAQFANTTDRQIGDSSSAMLCSLAPDVDPPQASQWCDNFIHHRHIAGQLSTGFLYLSSPHWHDIVSVNRLYTQL